MKSSFDLPVMAFAVDDVDKTVDGWTVSNEEPDVLIFFGNEETNWIDEDKDKSRNKRTRIWIDISLVIVSILKDSRRLDARLFYNEWCTVPACIQNISIRK